jgi:hypothetical protein
MAGIPVKGFRINNCEAANELAETRSTWGLIRQTVNIIGSNTSFLRFRPVFTFKNDEAERGESAGSLVAEWPAAAKLRILQSVYRVLLFIREEVLLCLTRKVTHRAESTRPAFLGNSTGKFTDFGTTIWRPQFCERLFRQCFHPEDDPRGVRR